MAKYRSPLGAVGLPFPGDYLYQPPLGARSGEVVAIRSRYTVLDRHAMPRS